MGNTWEVWEWTMTSPDEYEYELVYAGEDEDKAMRTAQELKDAGVIKCIKIIWRP